MTTSNPRDARPGPGRQQGLWWLLLLPVLVLSFNLRPVAVSIGPVLNEITADLGMTGAVAGMLTALPSICFAAFGALTPGVARRLGMHHTVGVALVALIAGQTGRVFATTPWVFLLLSVLALAGMAMCNILIPGLVRLHFPTRIGLATALYSLAMTIGITATSMGTVPLALAVGGWRAAYLALAGVALAALLAWLPMLRLNAGRHGRSDSGRIGMGQIARTRMGWLMAVFFGLQSAHAYSIFGWLPTIYMDAGMGQVDAGVMLGLATGMGIIPSFVVPRYAARSAEPVGVFLVIMGFLAVGFAGLLLAPMTLPWLWAVCLAFGTASFPLILALLGLRARTAAGTTALSGFAQSVGYSIAALGPIALGVLHANTTSWTPALLLLLSLVVPMTIVGVICCRSWHIEDELAKQRT